MINHHAAKCSAGSRGRVYRKAVIHIQLFAEKNCGTALVGENHLILKATSAEAVTQVYFATKLISLSNN